MAVIVDSRMTDSGSMPEVQENFNRVLKVADGKVDKPTATGTAGKVLQLDSNLKPVWGDVSNIVLASSTEGSTKTFRLSVVDDGTLTAVEIV